MLINFEEHSKKLNDFRQGKVPEALKLGHEEFDSHFRFVPSNLVMILGFPNIGKTHFTFYLMLLYALKHNLRFLIFSSENEPYTNIRRLIEMKEGKPLNKIEQKDYEDSLSFVYDHFKFFDCNRQYTYKELLKLGKSIKNAWNYDCLLIDPINSLRKDLRNTNSFEYGYEQLTEIRIFCKEQNISTWICCHTVTEALRKVHPKGHEFEFQPQVPTLGMAEGGQQNASRCDEFIILHRYIYDKRDWMYTRMYVAKVKNQELGFKNTSYDSPLMFKSIINNVGFELSGKNFVTYRSKKQSKLL